MTQEISKDLALCTASCHLALMSLLWITSYNLQHMARKMMLWFGGGGLIMI